MCPAHFRGLVRDARKAPHGFAAQECPAGQRMALARIERAGDCACYLMAGPVAPGEHSQADRGAVCRRLARIDRELDPAVLEALSELQPRLSHADYEAALRILNFLLPYLRERLEQLVRVDPEHGRHSPLLELVEQRSALASGALFLGVEAPPNLGFVRLIPRELLERVREDPVTSLMADDQDQVVAKEEIDQPR